MQIPERYACQAEVFAYYGINDISPIIARWQEPHRYYHNLEHLDFLIDKIDKLYEQQAIDEAAYRQLLMTAYFHDVVYDPRKQDNERQSAAFWVQQCQPSHPECELIRQMILDTESHKGQSELSKVFCDLDMYIVRNAVFFELLDWERKIFKEFQFLDYSLYKSLRIALLKRFREQYPENAKSLQHLIDYLEQYRPKVGVYPGSFNPFHNGHLNILEKAERIFDKVIIARGINPDKQEINRDVLNLKVLRYRQTENFAGFLTEYLSKKEKDADITLVRGLRNGDDLDYEVNQLRFMEEMKEDLQIIFITCDKRFEHISSSSIKNLDKIDANFSKNYLPQ